MATKLARSHGLSEGDVVIARSALEDLQGALYCLQTAIEDVDRDLEVSSEPGDVAEALRWLLDNARPLAATWIEPRTADPDPPPESPSD